VIKIPTGAAARGQGLRGRCAHAAQGVADTIDKGINTVVGAIDGDTHKPYSTERDTTGR
jgi:hypothetical protein